MIKMAKIFNKLLKIHSKSLYKRRKNVIIIIRKSRIRLIIQLKSRKKNLRDEIISLKKLERERRISHQN